MFDTYADMGIATIKQSLAWLKREHGHRYLLRPHAFLGNLTVVEIDGVIVGYSNANNYHTLQDVLSIILNGSPTIDQSTGLKIMPGMVHNMFNDEELGE